MTTMLPCGHDNASFYERHQSGGQSVRGCMECDELAAMPIVGRREPYPDVTRKAQDILEFTINGKDFRTIIGGRTCQQVQDEITAWLVANDEPHVCISLDPVAWDELFPRQNTEELLGLYNLAADGRTPVPCGDIREWQNAHRKLAVNAGEPDPWRVDKTELTPDIWVSTVFLGVDHRYSISEPPMLFETMIFGLADEYCERYATWDEAEHGHAAAVEFAKNSSESAAKET